MYAFMSSVFKNKELFGIINLVLASYLFKTALNFVTTNITLVKIAMALPNWLQEFCNMEVEMLLTIEPVDTDVDFK